MSTPRNPSPASDAVEASIRAASSIGDLERLAGIGRSLEDRTEFWRPFMALPARESLDAGVAELKCRVRARDEISGDRER